jgi:hypothetical protein
MQLSFLGETNMIDPDIRSLISTRRSADYQDNDLARYQVIDFSTTAMGGFLSRTMRRDGQIFRSLIFLQRRWVGFYQGQ